MPLLDLPDEVLEQILSFLQQDLCTEGNICGQEIRLTCKRFKHVTRVRASFANFPVLLVSRMLIPDPGGDTATVTLEGGHPFRCRAHIPRCITPSPYHSEVTARSAFTRPFRAGTHRLVKSDTKLRTLFSITQPLGYGPQSFPIRGLDTGRRRVYPSPTQTVTFFSPRRSQSKSQRRLLRAGLAGANLPLQVDLRVNDSLLQFKQEDSD